MTAVVENVRRFFSLHWPQTLQNWDEADDRFGKLIEEDFSDPGANANGYAEDGLYPETVTTICFAKDYSIPNVLPMAFYHLSRVPLSNDWSSRRNHPNLSDRLSAHTFSARWDLLRQEDWSILHAGRQKVWSFLSNIWSPQIQSHCNLHCRDPQRGCQSNVQRHTSLQNLPADDAMFSDPLRTLRVRFCNPIQALQEELMVCDMCARVISSCTTELREYLWSRLPEYYACQNPGVSPASSSPDSAEFLFDPSDVDNLVGSESVQHDEEVNDGGALALRLYG